MSDNNNSRIQITDSLGNVLSSIALPGFASSIAYSSTSNNLFANYMYVSPDLLGEKRLRVFDASNVLVSEFRYNELHFPNEPMSIAVAADGAIYVVLASTDKVLKLSYIR